MDERYSGHDPLREGGFETLCAHYGEHRLAHGGAAAPPLYQTTNFVYPDAEAFERRLLPQSPYYDYTRYSNPTTAVFEAKMARLERGDWARAFASGMGAITCGINACVHSGAHVVAVANCYPPTHEFLQQYLERFGVQVTFVPGVAPAAIVDALRDETRLVYLETPTWGRHEIIELAPVVEACRARGITTMIDNSWATPCFQRPIEHGIDLVAHSATKYIGGHSDTLGGVLVGRGGPVAERIRREAVLVGATLDPFAAWLLLRSLRTLGVRMERHQRSGLAIAELLAEHPKVADVYHPGLPSHPQHELAKQQLDGFSGVFSFALKEQSREAVNRVVNRLRLFSIGCSWGGHESLAIGGTLFDAQRDKPTWIIRLHVGMETTEDLMQDIRQALEE